MGDPAVWGFRADAAHPQWFPPSPSIPESNLSRALDTMIADCGAGYNHSLVYPAKKECHWTYNDHPTYGCHYPCLINEYLNFAHLATIGARDYQCADHEDEYSFCTYDKCKKGDPLGFALGKALPQILPSGHYAGAPGTEWNLNV